MGVNTQKNLAKVVEALTHYEFDALLISGDLTHHGTSGAYAQIKTILAPIKAPIYIIGGNHDDPAQLNTYFKDNLLGSAKLGNWQLIGLDSVQPNKASGLLSKATLHQLNQQLSTSEAEHIIVALHHPIVTMNSGWDDDLSLENPKDLYPILAQYSKIRCVVFGHAHESADFHHQHFAIVACPSTALQYNQESRIGFNEFTLHDNGQINWTTQWI